MEIVLFGLLAVLIVFMFFNTRRRNKQMAAEREEKAAKTVPGAKVMLQGGLYGTIVAFDPENLDKPALVELAPGAVVEVHSQAILRIVEPEDATEESDDAETESEEDTSFVSVETPEETRARLERDADDK
ncbi:preprotein translocase subunit YajC [Microbacterium tumbae]